MGFFFWDPRREIFTVPYLNLPIVWYGVFFAFGFAIGYYIFLMLLRRYLLNFPLLTEKMVFDASLLKEFFKDPKNKKKIAIREFVIKGQDVLLTKFSVKKIIAALNRVIDDPGSWQTLKAFYPKYKSKKIFQYYNILYPEKALNRLCLDRFFSPALFTIKKAVIKITDRLSFYMILATVIGARLGHLIFYEEPSHYLSNPLVIFQTWKGGLASHGAVVAILVAVFLFSKWVKKYTQYLRALTILDLISIPTALIGGFIRIGNFFNQEILGKTTTVFWAVQFGHPFDGSMPHVPRHPVQIYEALFYFFTFILLLYLCLRTRIFLQTGRLIGLFLVLVFTFRFLIEFLKEEQSALLSNFSLTMGQILSLPVIALGLVLLCMKRNMFKKI